MGVSFDYYYKHCRTQLCIFRPNPNLTLAPDSLALPLCFACPRLRVGCPDPCWDRGVVRGVRTT